jgi:hypothetical protein
MSSSAELPSHAERQAGELLCHAEGHAGSAAGKVTTGGRRSKMPNKRSSDLVQLCASTVCFRIRNGVLHKGTTDFEVLELGQSPNAGDSAQADVLVNFDARISNEDALAALQRVKAEIEKNGLPETTRNVLREYADSLMQLQQNYRELSAELEKLPEELRNVALDHLERPVPRISLVYDAAVEGNDHE